MLSQIDDFQGEPSAKEPQGVKRRLSAPFFHWNVRIAYASMGVCLLALAVRRASSLAREEIPWASLAGGIPVLIFATIILAANLRTCALYGSPEGLEIARWGKRRLVPWSKVGPAKFAWWSINFWARIATVRIHEEKEQTYRFFASHQVLDDFEAMRALYTRK